MIKITFVPEDNEVNALETKNFNIVSLLSMAN